MSKLCENIRQFWYLKILHLQLMFPLVGSVIVKVQPWLAYIQKDHTISSPINTFEVPDPSHIEFSSAYSKKTLYFRSCTSNNDSNQEIEPEVVPSGALIPTPECKQAFALTDIKSGHSFSQKTTPMRRKRKRRMIAFNKEAWRL